MHQQRGARWLAQQQHEIGAASTPELREEGGDPAQGHSDRHGPPQALYHLVNCMSERALAEFAEVLRQYGLINTH
jgi:hypothetical protein